MKQKLIQVQWKVLVVGTLPTSGSNGQFCVQEAVEPGRQVSILGTPLRVVGVYRDLYAEPLRPYFRDVYDHVLRVAEQNDSLRDLVSTILDTNLNLQSNRMNLIMKKVTSWAAIIAVPTAITGFYGQNVPYPGFSTAWGFWTSTAVIVLFSLALYIGFKKRDWI